MPWILMYYADHFFENAFKSHDLRPVEGENALKINVLHWLFWAMSNFSIFIHEIQPRKMPWRLVYYADATGISE